MENEATSKASSFNSTQLKVRLSNRYKAWRLSAERTDSGGESQACGHCRQVYSGVIRNWICLMEVHVDRTVAVVWMIVAKRW